MGLVVGQLASAAGRLIGGGVDSLPTAPVTKAVTAAVVCAVPAAAVATAPIAAAGVLGGVASAALFGAASVAGAAGAKHLLGTPSGAPAVVGGGSGSGGGDGGGGSDDDDASGRLLRDRWPGQSCTATHRSDDRYAEIKRGSSLQKQFTKVDGRVWRATSGKQPLSDPQRDELLNVRKELLTRAWSIFDTIDTDVVKKTLEDKKVSLTDENMKAQKALLILTICILREVHSLKQSSLWGPIGSQMKPSASGPLAEAGPFWLPDEAFGEWPT